MTTQCLTTSLIQSHQPTTSVKPNRAIALLPHQPPQKAKAKSLGLFSNNWDVVTENLKIPTSIHQST
ncbi:hypothetical protein Patl1_27642 [Pistacia atlantica]|uniref:Uncharacterized protein n=1 Tax=Pistacia atlantica TaxID=434234 RepID=A0ACC1BFF5_9ROSI|nr:hypothetical protein Patl1_27642 [Pistacia atlantica]